MGGVSTALCRLSVLGSFGGILEVTECVLHIGHVVTLTVQFNQMAVEDVAQAMHKDDILDGLLCLLVSFHGAFSFDSFNGSSRLKQYTSAV